MKITFSDMEYEVDWSVVMDKISKIDFSRIEDNIIENIENAYESHNNTYQLFNNVWRLLDGPTIPNNMKSFLSLMTYLLYVEGIHTLNIDIIIYYLIKTQHHDVWDEEKRRFISNYDDLARIPLATKLKFLTIHGYEEITEMCNKKLRNAIAHHEFNILDNGIVEYFSYGKRSEIDNLHLRKMIVDIHTLSAYINTYKGDRKRKR